MSDIKWFTRCPNCKRWKLFIRKHAIKMPFGTVTSQMLYCTSCHKKLSKKVADGLITKK